MPCTGFCASCPRGSLPGTERRPSAARGPSDGDAKPALGGETEPATYTWVREAVSPWAPAGPGKESAGLPGATSRGPIHDSVKVLKSENPSPSRRRVTAPGVPDCCAGRRSSRGNFREWRNWGEAFSGPKTATWPHRRRPGHPFGSGLAWKDPCHGPPSTSYLST